MAISAIISGPSIWQGAGYGVEVMKDPVVEASSQAWPKSSFVYTSGTGASVVLNGLATAGTVIYGLAPAVAVGTGAVTPPNTLFGTTHYPFDVRERIIAMNISGSQATIGTTSGATWTGSGTNGVALAAGQQYGVLVPTSGTYKGLGFVDVSNTTQKLFEIVAIFPSTGSATIATSDNNTRVLVKVIPTVIQG